MESLSLRQSLLKIGDSVSSTMHKCSCSCFAGCNSLSDPDDLFRYTFNAISFTI